MVDQTFSGADLGGRANHSSGSLKQGVWGAQPPKSYRMDLEYLIQLLKFCKKKLTKAVPGGVVGATL